MSSDFRLCFMNNIFIQVQSTNKASLLTLLTTWKTKCQTNQLFFGILLQGISSIRTHNLTGLACSLGCSFRSEHLEIFIRIF